MVCLLFLFLSCFIDLNEGTLKSFYFYFKLIEIFSYFNNYIKIFTLRVSSRLLVGILCSGKNVNVLEIFTVVRFLKGIVKEKTENILS